jgi:hypothetical protein
MRGTVAKRLRREVYEDRQPRSRKYYVDKKTGQLWADQYRNVYQQFKKRHMKGDA